MSSELYKMRNLKINRNKTKIKAINNEVQGRQYASTKSPLKPDEMSKYDKEIL
jgi:hypothetical protein